MIFSKIESFKKSKQDVLLRPHNSTEFFESLAVQKSRDIICMVNFSPRFQYSLSLFSSDQIKYQEKFVLSMPFSWK